MKKRHIDLELLRRLEIRKHEKRLLEKTSKKKRRTQYKRKKFINKQDPFSEAEAPEAIDLGNNRDEVCEFFRDIRDLIKFGRRVKIDFSRTKLVSPDGLIFLLSQIQKIRFEFGVNAVTGTYPLNSKVNRLFSDSGFFKVLGVRPPKIQGRPQHKTRYLLCKSESSNNSALIPKIKQELLGSNLEMPTQVGKLVYRALSEAMINVGHHAYDGKSLKSKMLKNRWWVGGQLSRGDNTFTLTFYDVGVGIPKRLQREHGWEWIRGVLSLLPGIMPDDGQMLCAAVKIGRSSTRKSNRGKGLMDMHKLIEKVNSGSLTIYSRNGYYSFSNGTEKHGNCNGFVEGTLIKWHLPLDQAVKFVNQDSEQECDDEFK